MADENIYTFENETYRKTYWHTCSHVLAQAMKRLHPEVKLAIGPSIDNGFYYDFDTAEPFSETQLAELEAEMRKICKEKLKLERFELPREEAIRFMEEKGEPYKVELIQDLPEDAVISFYRQGDFTDLCAGPHLDSTGRIKGNGIKLTACNAAYWRGDSNRQTLQRIYGVAFPKKDELDEYLARIEEAKKRDHRKLGKELGLFMLRDEGPGFPFFLPKGMVLRNTLIDYWRQVHKRYGYVECSTPMMMNRQLWERSG
ncbi:MAG: threonine--tRNA ligase, partial [Ruminococcaceae bacterium]|nr:threonine--tRNA ligase [Oscillospiraceae bacterium]